MFGGKRLGLLSAGAALLVTTLGAALTPAANAASRPADVYSQKCNNRDGMEVCVSYDYTSLFLAANYLNSSNSIQTVHLTLTFGSYGNTEFQAVTPNQWFGFGVRPSGGAPGNACASAFVNSNSTIAVCGVF
jgi:hypothetical protein